ncbi:probable palmitoyltransferase ZDHHC12 isoform X5 [Trachypithecus francoisi]|uniref:probable palmitoyltransferase ZDHHC12 isoform X5 n=1 Tax=Trachypithecus francoisi TaxID=54180 RepID=UPI00141B4C96|nr:probable palmitoyltransferase ZDHHC12 isoform X5 [Trachypithecus francoisi]
MAPWALLSPGVLVRTGHTVLTWGITLVLFLHDTELRQWEEQGELLLPLTFLLLVLGSLLLYLAVSLMDPGYVNVQPQPQELKEEQTAMVPPAIPLRRCRYCLVLVRPPVLPALGTVAAIQRAPVHHLPAAVPLLVGGQPAPCLAPLPGGQQHHHLGIHLLTPHRLSPPAPRQPLRPRPDPQPGPLLLWVALGVLGDPLGGGGGQQPSCLGLLEAGLLSCA